MGNSFKEVFPPMAGLNAPRALTMGTADVLKEIPMTLSALIFKALNSYNFNPPEADKPA
ncbi:MAG: hypothetical protein HQ551_12235 [Desulfobacteraceae bacterium]|nr:hypothetical protein [Desulfobacteraceae bacterium]